MIRTPLIASDQYNYRRHFPNILDIKNTPVSEKDRSSYCFSDLGAWFGFALPDESEGRSDGGFSGPFMMGKGRWLGKLVARPVLSVLPGKQPLLLQNAEKSRSNFFPGRLEQYFRFKQLALKQSLIYLSAAHLLLLLTKN